MPTDNWYQKMSERARERAAAHIAELQRQEERQRYEASLCGRCHETMEPYTDKDPVRHVKAGDEAITVHLRCCLPDDVFVWIYATPMAD